MNLKKIDMPGTGLKLRMLRVGKKLTQRQLAAEIDLTPVLVSNIERGAVNLTMDNAIRFKQFYDCNFEDFKR